MSDRRAAQTRRVVERNAFVAEQAAAHARARRAIPDPEKAALTEVFVSLWEKCAENFPPPMVTLLRWLVFGIIPMVGSVSVVLLGSRSWDPLARPFEAATAAVACAVLLLALVMASAVGLARLGALSVRVARRVVTIATVVYGIVWITSLALGLVLVVLALGEPAPAWVRDSDAREFVPFLLFAQGPPLLLAVALVVYHADVRSARAIERFAARCGGRLEVGASALRRWLDRHWEGEVSHEQLERRSDSAYLVSTRIDGFEVAIEIRSDSGTRPPIQVLVAAALEQGAHPALGGLDAWLQSSGFVAQGSTGGIAARPGRGGGRSRNREDELLRLHGCAVDIVAFLQRAGVHPVDPLEG